MPTHSSCAPSPHGPYGRRGGTRPRHQRRRCARTAGCRLAPSAAGSLGSHALCPTARRAGPGRQAPTDRRRRGPLVGSPATERGPEAIEVGDAIRTAHDAFAVQGHRLDSERQQRLGDRRRSIGMVIATPREHTHSIAVAVADKTIPIVLDLVDPHGPGWHGVGVGRQARLDEADRVTNGCGRPPTHVHFEAESVGSLEVEQWLSRPRHRQSAPRLHLRPEARRVRHHQTRAASPLRHRGRDWTH